MRQHYDPLYERSMHQSYKQLALTEALVLRDAEDSTLREAAHRLMA